MNYDILTDGNCRPDCETYLHRIGCTGRFRKSGLAINFVDGQHSMKALQTIREHFGKPIEVLDTDDYDAMEKLQT